MDDEELFALLTDEERELWPSLDRDTRAALRDSATPRVPPTDELRALTARLYALHRRGAGRVLRPHQFEGAEVHKCFENAKAWVEAHPGHSLVWGFLYFDFDGRWPHVRFVPHAAVQTENREWLDVTPHGAEGEPPFLQNPGTDQEFQAAVRQGPMDFVYR